MADMEQNLSLADALTEPPPQIEEEVKRDFMASLEAEKFDDVIGEKVGKTDYVPLLDDEDGDGGGPKAENQETKATPRAENLPRERPSAIGPAAVMENGDHGLESNRPEPSGKISEEDMSYKEFLDHDSWTMDDGRRCFESPLGFEPLDVAGPYGTAELSEHPSLGFTHPTAAAFEPLSFLGTGPIPSRAAPFRPTAPPPEDFWLAAPHLAEGQGPAPFFQSPEAHKVPFEVEKHHPGGDEMVFSGELSPPEAEQAISTVPPAFGAALPTMEELMGFQPSLDYGLLPPQGTQAGFSETPVSKELRFEDEDIIVLPAETCPTLEKPEEGKKVLQSPKGEDRRHPEDPTLIRVPAPKFEKAQPCLPFHAGEEDLSPFPSFETEDLVGSPTQRGEKKDESKVTLAPQMQEVTSQRSPVQKADGPPVSPAQKADGPPHSPVWKADGPPLSPGLKADGPPLSPGLKADGPPVSPAQKADGPPLSPGQKAGGPPVSPGLKADGPPLSPVQKADGPPHSPVWKADGPPLSPGQKAGGPPLSLGLKADGLPISPGLKADGPLLSPSQKVDGSPVSPGLKADGPPHSPVWKADGPPLSPSQKAGGPPLSPGLKADEPPVSPAQKADGPPHSPVWKADGPPLSPSQKADGPPISPSHKADGPPISPGLKADGPPISPVQKAGGPPLSPVQKAGGPPLSPLWKADTPPLSPIRKSDPLPSSPTQPAEKAEETSPFLATPEIKSSSWPAQLPLDLPGQEKLYEKKENQQQPPGSPEKLKEPTAAEAGGHLPDPTAVSMGSLPGEKPQVGPPGSVVEEPPLVKESAVHPVEPWTGPEGGIPSPQIRHAPKTGDHHQHRRFGHSKPVLVPLADAPEEHLTGSPTPKSHGPRGDSFFAADLGSFGGPSPRAKRWSKKGTGPALEVVEASRDLPQEGWDPEASAALKKKKKKAKQKKGQPPRGVDTWDDKLRSSPAAGEAPCLLQEGPKEVFFSTQLPGHDPSKLGQGGRQADGHQRPSLLPTEVEDPSRFPLDPRPGERSQVKPLVDDGSAWQPKGSPKGELPEEQKKQLRSSSSPSGAEEVGSLEKNVELASGTPPKTSNVDGSTWEADAAVGQKIEVQTVDPLVAPDQVPAEFQGLERKEEPGEKPKKLEEVFKKGVVKRDLHLPADSNLTEGTSLHQGGEDTSGVSRTPEERPRSQPPGSHSAQTPFMVESTSDPAQPLFVGGGPVFFTDPTEELLGVHLPELPTALKLGRDQPKKRGSDGKSKKAKHLPEVEEKIGWSKASAVVDVEGLGEIGWTTRNPEETLSTSPGVREKTKKRSSVGKSRKSEERSSFGQPFFSTVEDHLASRQMFDPTQQRGEEEEADITAADGLKQLSPPLVPLSENIKGSPDGLLQRVEQLPSAYPFISEALEKQKEDQLLLESKVHGPDQNKGPPLASPPSGGEDLSLAWATSKPKKRSSDGRSKASRRGLSTGQPLLWPEKTSDERDGMVSSKKGDFVQEGPPEKNHGLELPGTTQVDVLLEITGGKEEKNVGLEALSASEEKASTVKTAALHETKETLSNGHEANQARGGEGPSKPQVVLPQVLEEVKKPETDLQGLQVPKVLDMKAEPSTEDHRGVKMEEVPTSAGPKEETSEPLLKHPGQLPAELLVDDIFGGQKKGTSGPDGPTLEQDTSETGRVLEAERKVKTKASRSSREKKDGGSDLSDPQPSQKSTEKKSKKIPIVPQEPTKEDVHREDPRRGGGLDFPVGEAKVVDENRNIQSLPSGRQLRWEEDLTDVFDPAGALEDAPAKPRGPTCPFLQRSGKSADEEQFGLPRFLPDAKPGDQKILEELQENLAKLAGQEAEASLVMKAGDDTREKRKKKRTIEDRHLKAETHHGSGSAESTELKDPREGLGPPGMVVEKPKMAPGLVAEGKGSVGEGNELPTETQALVGSEKEASTLPTAAAVLDGGSSQPGTVAEGRREAEPRPADSSGNKLRTDNVPVEEVANLSSDRDKDAAETVPLFQSTDEETGQLRETTGLQDAASLGSEAGEPSASAPLAPDRGNGGPPGEIKKASRTRSSPSMKGYMRPTKSRGLPSPRDAGQDRGRRRPGKAEVPGLPGRRDQAEEVKASAEVPSAEEPAALPGKDLPPSPDKKNKPSAATATGAKPAPAKSKPGTAGVPPMKRPASATLGSNKKTTAPGGGPTAAAPAPKRPSSGLARPSSLTPRELKPKGTDGKSPDKRVSPSKTPSATTPRNGGKTTPGGSRPTGVVATVGTSPGPRSTTATALPPKKTSAIKTDVKAADAKKAPAKSPTADLSRPRSAPASTTASPAPSGPPAGRPKPKPVAAKPPGTASVPAEPKKPSLASKALPKTSPGASKPPRPTTSVSVPDLKNVRSKIGSTDNIKYQPGGGKAKVEKKGESALAARKLELGTVSKAPTNKSTVSKESLAKSPNGKVQILSKKVNYSHVQSKCGSKDNIKHIPGGGNVQNVPKPASGNKSQPRTTPKPSPGCTNVQILNKKIDLSKVASKCGSKTNIKHKPGGGDVKIENQKLSFKEKAQAKVGSLDNVGHVPAGGTVKTEGDKEAAPENGGPPSGSSAPQENGAGPLAPAQGGGDQREIQSFNTHIQETSL
ncbi:protein bassoon-like isoform X4 [Crotalus tigris]|uniref:protein bassoon-like isoform X4 n=1 Tax=Crotalus tigris TaxID=88082 RepID=UPI00192F6D50|nr:protein bassoon-like isoform X4 [Crotalus tigris]